MYIKQENTILATIRTQDEAFQISMLCHSHYRVHIGVDRVIRNSTRWFFAFSRAVVVTLLLAQTAFAAQPCGMLGMSPASEMPGQMGDDCETHATSASKLCAIKCADSDKSTAYAPWAVPLPPTGTILILPSLPDNALVAVAMRSLVDPVKDPPKTIRFCSFLI